MTDEPTMTKAEREELAKVVRMRAKVAALVSMRGRLMFSPVDEQLAEQYRFDDAQWAAITAAANRVVEEADEQIRLLCEAQGIPAEFRPEIRLGWYGRGENVSKDRRAELRRAAVSRVDAGACAAKLAIDTTEAQLRGDLAARANNTAEAQTFLNAMPTPEQLMPELAVGDFDLRASRQTQRDSRTAALADAANVNLNSRIDDTASRRVVRRDAMSRRRSG